jgi:hypothetical protein
MITAWNIRIPTRRLIAWRASTAVISNAPDRRRAAQHAQPPWPGMQNVAGVDRQQRRRSAQQHGEQIERYRPQYRRVAAHEPHAGEQSGKRRRLFGRTGRSSLIAPFSIPASNQNTAITA